jgi:copper homeostasis protein
MDGVPRFEGNDPLPIILQPPQHESNLPEIRSPSSPRLETRAPLLEICVETLTEAIQAAEAGATRLEICACMSEAGTTPSIGLITAIVERVNVPAFVMIRPRGGDFMFDASELDVMRRDIDAAKRAGAKGIVSGALETGCAIDPEATKSLVDAAGPLPFTFHRAFDLTPELERAIDVLRSIGVNRVLTSGGASSAIVGAGAIARLSRRAGAAMTIVAGGGIRADHVAELVQLAGVTEVHARPTRARSASVRSVREVRFGPSASGSGRAELDPDAVRALVRALADSVQR